MFSNALGVYIAVDYSQIALQIFLPRRARSRKMLTFVMSVNGLRHSVKPQNRWVGLSGPCSFVPA
jgi:hypothetical protein